MAKKQNKARKYLVLSFIFVLVCLIFVARLVFLQFNFEKTDQLRSESEYTTETKIIQALRGNICDRNGNVLVTTSYAYDIIFDYDDMPSDFVEFNQTILKVLDAMNATQSNEYRTADLYPLVGEYPNLAYSTDAMTEGTATNKALNKILKDFEMEGASADELVSYLVKRWKFNKLDKNGSPIYSERDINRLLRVRYDMVRTQFSSVAPYCIASRVDLSLVTYLKELSIVGVSDRISAQRTYTYPGYASHILGTVGGINAENWDYYKELGYTMDALVGASGCEQEFEEYLRGKNGVKTITRNGEGEIVKEEITTEPIAGKDVYLTIDIETQIAAEDALAEYMKTYNKNSGASVAVDPNTGEILAIASYPTYDLTTFSKDYSSLLANKYSPLINRAIGAVYAPGSTFKIATALAGLESGGTTANTTVYCNRGYNDNGIRIKCENHNTYHTNDLNVIEAITFSCNAYFIETGYDMIGIDTMTQYCASLGLGQSTGIELSEKIGQIACPENTASWTPYEEASSYIGQSIHQYTPLQVTSYISTVANGGIRYATHLLHSVRSFSGEVVCSTEKTVLSTVDISSSTLSTIKTGMKEMIENSSSANWNMYTKYEINDTVCGKSGTAQIGGDKQNCWFTAFAPMNNPQIVVTSIIENGDTGASVSEIDAAVIATWLNK